MAEISGGEVIARMLQKEGVEKVFGIIDGTYFGFYSALHRLGIEIVTPRHETCAAHMAGTYARLTGKLGVCMASNGPGVANLLPGLVVEQADGNRVLAITSARRPTIMYPDRGGSYQCFDQSGVIGKIGKWSAAVSSFDRVPGAGEEGLAQELGRAARRGACRCARDHHEWQGQGRRQPSGRRTSTATPYRQRRLLSR
jgi:acetolactate synthase-1/2/3 large subunit